FNGNGASEYSTWLKYGYTASRYKVGDTVQTETGNMVGPTKQALALTTDGGDADSRFQRATDSPTFVSDLFSNFHSGNLRIVTMPLVDWLSASGGKSTLVIKGF